MVAYNEIVSKAKTTFFCELYETCKRIMNGLRDHTLKSSSEQQPDSLVEMAQICKDFPGVRALDEVSLKIERGKVHALVGENGAGKSTLMKILAGVYLPDRGYIKVRGRKVEIRKPIDSLRAGISMIHQEFNLIPALTVSENIFFGREACLRFFPFLDKQKQRSMTKDVLDEIGIDLSPDARISNLRVAEMQMVEIAKAISCKSDVIIMDEPSSAITDREVTRLFDLIQSSQAKGIAIVYITHKINEVFRISDTVTILRDGKHICTRTTPELSQDELIAMMVGREIGTYFPREHVQKGEVNFKVMNLSKKQKFDKVSFEARRGEILGIAGLMGAGRTEIAEAIIGLDPADSGEIFVNGKRANIRRPFDAIRRGIAFVPEDRKLKGLNLKASVGHNMTIANLRRYCRFGQVIMLAPEKRAIEELIRLLGIKTRGKNQNVNSLSGGNQQKVVLAKSLTGSPDVFIFDEPTRGIDVGAKREIYRLMKSLAIQAKTIIMISSEMPEIIGMSDRVIVLHDGRISGEFRKEEFDQEAILACAMGHERHRGQR